AHAPALVRTSILHALHSELFFLHLRAPTDPYTLSLHDALPIWSAARLARGSGDDVHGSLVTRRAGRRLGIGARTVGRPCGSRGRDRKSTRLNSSHVAISYAVFCLQKKRTMPRSESSCPDAGCPG